MAMPNPLAYYCCRSEQQPHKISCSPLPKAVLEQCISMRWSGMCIACSCTVVRLGNLAGPCLA